MDNNGIKQIIKFIENNCWTTLTPKQFEKLREMKHMPEYDISKVRLLYRIAIDNFVFPECPYCHEAIQTQEDLTIDHIIPRANGGTDDIKNLQPMHKHCNCDKGCAMPEVTTCDEVPVKKHRKPRNNKKHKQREIIKSRTPEELYNKCRRADYTRTGKHVRGRSR